MNPNTINQLAAVRYLPGLLFLFGTGFTDEARILTMMVLWKIMYHPAGLKKV
jgi:hypothetical protein